jgi:arylsulfatase
VTLAAAVAALALLAAGCPALRGDPGPPRRVFLLTVDTLRADHVSFLGYGRDTTPHLRRLAAEGVVFERAMAQWPKTGPSFASMFTGRYPQSTGLTHKAALPLPADYLAPAELFHAAGFRTAAVVSNGVVGARLGWDQGFDEYLETWKLAGREVSDPVEYREWSNARRVNELALPLLERLRGADRLFVWLHYSDPHAPYVLPRGERNPFVGDALYRGDEQVALDEAHAALGERRDLKHYVAQYDANVRVADAAIGEVLARARELGLLDDALIVATADHGEALGEHGYYFGHGRLPHNPGLHVPLVFHRPGALAPRRVAEVVELVDLYPTLRELVLPEHEVPGLEGRSLAPLLRGDGAAAASPAAGSDRAGAAPAPRYAFAGAGGGAPLTHFRTVQDARWKLVYHPAVAGRRPLPREQRLYDLAQDPGETEDVAAAHPQELRRLAAALSRWMKGGDWIQIPRQEVAARSRETAAALRALGYVD